MDSADILQFHFFFLIKYQFDLSPIFRHEILIFFLSKTFSFSLPYYLNCGRRCLFLSPIFGAKNLNSYCC